MENHRDNNIVEIDLLEIISILLNRFWVIFGAALLAVTYSDVQMGTQLTKDYAELINSRYVLETVIGQLSLPEMEYKDLLKKVSVHTPTDTRIVSITVTDYDPQQAQNIANCIREVAGEHIQNVMDIEAVNVVEEAKQDQAW